jgi:hypothetical protein
MSDFRHTLVQEEIGMRYPRGAFMNLLLAPIFLASTFGVAAEQVTAEKQAPVVPSFDKVIRPYVYVSSRYYSTSYKDTRESAETMTQIRPFIGLTLLDGKYDLLFFTRYNKSSNSAQVQNGTSELFFTPKAYTVGPVALGGYYQQILAQGGNPADHVLALTTTATHSVETAAGKFDLLAYGEFDTILYGGEKTTLYKRKRGGSLDATPAGMPVMPAVEESEGPKRQPGLYTEFDVGVTYRPFFDKKLAIGMTNYIKSTYDEVVDVDADGEERSSYKQNNITEEMVSISYQISDSISLVNETYFRQQGYYERDLIDAENRKEKFQNLTRLEVTLF